MIPNPSKMKSLKILFLIIIPLLLISCFRQQPSEIQLDQNWEFSELSKNTWYPAEVPGYVHTYLLNNKLINDPYFGDNEKELQWISEKDWKYKTYLFVDDELMKNENIELVFEGLDCYADVYINNVLILQADNMFREWVTNIKDFINIGKNEIIINFKSPLKVDSVKAAQLPYKLPENRAFSRKAPYQYGWDWGPTLISSGIWKNVFIRTWADARINYIQIIQDSIASDTAWLHAGFEINSIKDQDALLTVFEEGNRTPKNKIRVHLKEGNHSYPIHFTIEQPELWWTNGLGDQKLYNLKFRLQTQQALDEKQNKIGIRTIELVRNPDSIGESFYFKLNEIPVFMKGANYIPQDNFPPRVEKAKYEKLLKATADANMNMLRVWGGGIYEDDVFYDLCDKLGILVWQDFMFAGSMYPGDDEFIDNVKQEAIQQVKRLRNHPSLAMWCGNNEVDEAWHNWGWQKSLNYSDKDSAEVWSNYLKLFEKTLPEIIEEYDNFRSYIPSSPQIGWGHEEAQYSGDMHYWGVWWGEEPFEKYEENVGRFMSEYGFQGFPDLKTLQSYLSQPDLSLNSEALKNHQKHPRGMELIEKYMAFDYHIPDKFEDYVYVSQLVQAYGMNTAIEAHRRAKPVCMGTLYWQLNDCWPVISWSGIDYEGRWKALHYFTKKAYADYFISFEENNNKLDIFVVSDKIEGDTAGLVLQLMDFAGTIILEEQHQLSITGNTSTKVLSIDLKDFLGEHNPEEILLFAQLTKGNITIADNIYYLAKPKKLNLSKPEISHEIKKTESGFSIILKTNTLAKNIYLSIDSDGTFSDNYFDLIPGKSKEVNLKSKEEIPDISNLKIMSLYNTYLGRN